MTTGTYFKISVNIPDWPWDSWRKLYNIAGVGENLLVSCGSCGCEGRAEDWVVNAQGCKSCGWCKNNFCGCDCCGCDAYDEDVSVCCGEPISELAYDGWRCAECEYCADCDTQHSECSIHCVGCCDDEHYLPEKQQAKEYGGENHSDAFEYMLSYEKKPKEVEDEGTGDG